MSVDLVNPLPALAFSRNPIPVTLASDDVVNADGIVAVNKILVTGTVNVGTVIQFAWGNGNVTMTTAYVIDDTGTKLPVGVSSDSYLANIAQALKYNPYLDADFVITNTSTQVLLTARETGADSNITPYSSGGIAITVVTSGVDQAIKPNFKHFIEFWLGGIRKYRATLSLDYPAVAGITTKDLSELVNPFLDYDIPNMLDVWQVCTKSVQSGFIKYAEVYGDTPQIKQINISSAITFCLGGYSQLALGGITDPEHLKNYLLPDPALYQFQRWFETFPLDNFEVKTNQPMLLYFMNMRAIAESLIIAIHVMFTDGSTTDVMQAGGTLQPGQKVAIGAGYLQLALDALTDDTRTVAGYQVKLIEPISQEDRSVTKTFTVNREYEAYTRYIMYSDSAGNFKTLRAYGRSAVTADVTDTQVQRFDGPDTPISGSFTRSNIKLVENDELNTGYLVGDQSLDQLSELALARYAFRVFGTRVVPIIITTSDKILFEADGINLFATKITYRLAFDEKLYTGSTGALIVPRLNQSQQSLNDI